MGQADSITVELAAEGTAQRTWEELPEHLYHARPEWSKTQWCLLPDEPELFEGRHIKHIEAWQVKPSAAMEFGSAIHASILQGQPLKIIPADVLSKSGSRAGGAWTEWKSAHPEDGWLKEADADPYRWAIDSVMRNRRARALLELPGLCEHSIFWQHPSLDLFLRARLDKYCQVGNGVVLDLKTTADPSPESFPFKCLDYAYHLQAAAYMWGVEEVLGVRPDAFAFIVVGNTPPFNCHVYQPDDEFLTVGYTRMADALHDLDRRLKSGDWTREDRDFTKILFLPKKAFFNP